MSDYPFKYKCSICGELVSPDGNNISSHTEMERTKGRANNTWPGYLAWERVDDED